MTFGKLATIELTNATLHHAIISTIVDRGYAPTHHELSVWSRSSIADVIVALENLADYHGVVLHPGSREIWVAHPFSLAPTGYMVRAGDKEWWGTCAWCSLGVVDLVGGTATITTQLAWSNEKTTLRIQDHELLDNDYVVHFPIPMAKAWNNVIYTCSMMLLFKDGHAVDQWCERHGKSRGDVRPVQRIWEFSREWYGHHLDADWRKWTAQEAAAMFKRHGLDGPTWELPTSGKRF